MSKLLHKARVALDLIGGIGVWQALRYGLLRDHLERRFRAAQDPSPWAEPGPFVGVDRLASGARWRFAHTAVEVVFLAPDLVRCAWAGGTPPVPYALVEREWPPVAVELREATSGWELASAALTVQVGRDGALAWCDPAGRVLREVRPLERTAEGWAQRAVLRPEEALYGLGERATALNLRGRCYRLWNRDPATYQPGEDPLYLSIPVLLGLHDEGSYLVFCENTFDGVWDLGASEADTAALRLRGGALREYVIAGPPDRALARYTELTGRAPVPPRWALGYQQSRWGYGSAEEIRAVVAGFKQHDLPLAAIHLDLEYMQGHRVFTVNRRRFPDLGAMARELAAQGVRLVTIVDAAVKWDERYDVLRDGLRGGHFCTARDGTPVRAPVWPGMCAFPDFTRAATRAWWGQYYTRLLDAGVAGCWHDMNEPSAFAPWGEATLPSVTQHDLEGRGGDHREGHNVYGLQEVRAAHEALREQRPAQRPLIVSRAGWAGLQRYAWTWTGDTVSTWAALRQTISTVLGLGLSGIPYSGPDIGGFYGEPSAELFLRWFQMAAFMPLFRNHSAITSPRREPWRFGEPYLSILRETMRLRERLTPYLYTLCHEAAQTGAPPVRPLWWADTADRALWNVDDAFLLGDALLVVPVLELEATVRRFTLPAGTWYDYGEDTLLEGPGCAERAATLGATPLLVRAGSILPLAEGDALVLHVYTPPCGSAGSGSLYSDDGDGYGAGRLDHWEMQRDEAGIRIAWQSVGEFPWPYAHVRVHLHGATAGRVWRDGAPVDLIGPSFEVGMFGRLDMAVG